MERDTENKKAAQRKKRRRKKTRQDITTLAMFVAGIGLVLFSGIKLYGIFSDYHKSNSLYQNVQEHYVTANNAGEEKGDDTENAGGQGLSDVPWYHWIEVDFDGLKAQNPDVVGWIFFENEDISYPVLYSGDNSTYLRMAMDHTPATAGCIFVEGANHPDFEDCHTIIYGHNMHNLSMFGRLKYYKEENYYQDHRYFQIHTQDGIYRYQIFAYSDVPEDSAIYTVLYSPDDEFQGFIEKMYQDSYRNTGVEATKDDKIITLSTCSSKEDRFVVHAVRVGKYVSAK